MKKEIAYIIIAVIVIVVAYYFHKQQQTTTTSKKGWQLVPVVVSSKNAGLVTMGGVEKMHKIQTLCNHYGITRAQFDENNPQYKIVDTIMSGVTVIIPQRL